MTTDPAQQSRDVLAKSMVASGVILVALGIVLGIAVEPILFLVAAIGLVDFGFAWAFKTGKIGAGATSTLATADQPAAGPDVTAAEATDDPNYNPYARED